MVLAMETLMDMVRQLIFIVSCLILESCTAQKDSLLYDTSPIDSKLFYKHRSNSNRYKYYTQDSTYIYVHGYVKLGDTARVVEEYVKRVTPKGSVYMYIYIYREDGSLHKMFKSYPNRFTVYSIHYDLKGKIIKEINYDKLYPYTFKDVQQFIKSRGVALKDARVARDASDGAPGWSVTWESKKNPYKEIQIILDGKTGEIIEESKYRIQE